MICRAKGLCKEKCDRHCILTVGDNMVRFLREIDTIESKIGEFSNDDLSSKTKYIISGMQIDYTGNPTYLLADISTPIDVSKKFGSALSKTAMSLLNDYIKASEIEDGQELKDKLRKIENNKLLIVPVKPKMNCEVLIKNEKEGKSKEVLKSTHIDIVKWLNNSKTNTLECMIITDVIEGASGKRCKVNLEEYGDRFRLSDIERSMTNSDVDRGLIKMSRFGYVRPVALVDKNKNGVILDNTYMYLVDGDNIKTIAYWDKNELKGEEIYKEMTKTILYKKIKKNLNYIWQHRRFMAPYGLVDCQVVEV